MKNTGDRTQETEYRGEQGCTKCNNFHSVSCFLHSIPAFCILYSSCAALLFFAQVLNAQDTLEKDPAAFVRDGYHRLARDSFGDYDEYRKLLDSCKLQIAILAENDPEGLVALAREIIPEGPTLLEGEKQRGLKPGRLELKSSLMSAVVIVGGDDAYKLLMELKEKVESGDAQKQALGANPADLLEVPVKFDRMLSDALEGNSADPYNDLKNAIRFAQEHFVARVLLAESIPNLTPEQLLEMKKLTLERIRGFPSSAKFSNPLAALVMLKVVATVGKALGLGDRAQMPDNWYERLSKALEKRPKKEVRAKPGTSAEPSRKKPAQPETALPDQASRTDKTPVDRESVHGTSRGSTQDAYLLALIVVLGAVAVGTAFLLLHRRRKR